MRCSAPVHGSPVEATPHLHQLLRLVYRWPVTALHLVQLHLHSALRCKHLRTYQKVPSC